VKQIESIDEIGFCENERRRTAHRSAWMSGAFDSENRREIVERQSAEIKIARARNWSIFGVAGHRENRSYRL
jgi:hypothetical protein